MDLPAGFGRGTGPRAAQTWRVSQTRQQRVDQATLPTTLRELKTIGSCFDLWYNQPQEKQRADRLEKWATSVFLFQPGGPGASSHPR